MMESCDWCQKGMPSGVLCSEECCIAWSDAQEKARESEAVNREQPYTVVGRYPGSKAVVVHVSCEHSWDAKRCAVQSIAKEIGNKALARLLAHIPGQSTRNNVTDDFDLIIVLKGHAMPAPAHREGGFLVK